jgi:uncharacterized phiE125 gp8 family phage protein
VAELKTHSRIEFAEEDTYLGRRILGAREDVESFTRRRLITQTLDEFFDRWPCGDTIRLGASPIQSVSSVKFFDEDDVETLLASTEYVTDLNSTPPRIRLKRDLSWPTTTLREVAGVVVRYIAGYGDDPEDVPERLREAIEYLAATRYENRENYATGTVVAKLPETAEALMWPYRVLEAV